ncbi:MAG: hypothetical protein K2M97_06685, partial [Muribaculaceae bacterium]|nr:hypothetical protein [Muribaculaceae bacterium]
GYGAKPLLTEEFAVDFHIDRKVTTVLAPQEENLVIPPNPPTTVGTIRGSSAIYKQPIIRL